MGTSEASLSSDIGTILNAKWNIRNGTVVPTTDDVNLSNGAVKLDAVVLYADLFHSTELQRDFDNRVVAKVVRSYLSSMTKLISAYDGVVRSFDGDRVMGIFIGGRKNTNAATCALKMKYTVDKILRPKVEAKYASFQQNGFVIRHCAGVASSEVFVVRGGVRGTNDLVFVGSAPNIAAKLSEIRAVPYSTWITWSVYNRLQDSAKLADGTNMWVATKKTLAGVEWDVYKSSWHWKP